MKKLSISIILLINFLGFSASASQWRDAAGLERKKGRKSITVKTVESSKDKSVFVYSVSDPRIEQTSKKGERFTLGNALQKAEEGEPVLPVIPVNFVIPAGRKIDKISAKGLKETIMPGEHYIEFGGTIYPLIPDVKVKQAAPKASIYESDKAFPQSRYSLVTIQKKHGVSIAIITLNPAVYHPKSGKLKYFKEIQLEISTTDEKMPGLDKSSVFPLRINPQATGIENSEAIESYSASRGNSAALGMCNPLESFEYVLVTSEDIRDASTDYTVNDLISHRQAMGMTAVVKTIESILNDYPGVDDAEKLRNFIIDAYANWETRYVLLGGDINIIPMRKLYVSYSIYNEHIPSDLYYQCLDGPYNYDGDSYWGETDDGKNGGDVDLMAEVFIGRASAENPQEMANFIYKTLKYETDPESSEYLRTALMCGEYLGFGGVSDYAKASMEEIRFGASTHGYTTEGFASAPIFTVNTLYEEDAPWNKSDIIQRFNNNEYSIINHLGHANTSYVMMFYNSDADLLTNTNPLFVYSQGCLPGNFEGDCIAEHLTTSTRSGCYGGVLNSRYGWGMGNSTDGPSQRFDRQFWDAYFDENMVRVGELNADSHEDNLWGISSAVIRWCYVETNLFCDPFTRMRGLSTGPIVSYHSHSLNDQAGNGNGIVEPGEQIKISVSLVNNGSEDASGVNAEIATEDAFVTIYSNDAGYGDISSGEISSSPDSFIVNISSNCPTPHTANFTLTMTGGESNTWESTFLITINSVSQISGNVISFTGSDPVPDAVVYYFGPVNGSDTTDAEGNFNFSVVDGSYSLYVESRDYLRSDTAVVTTPPSTFVEFSLYRPIITVTPAEINEVLMPGEISRVDIEIENTGDAKLDFQLTAVDESADYIIRPERIYDLLHFAPLKKGEKDTRTGQSVILGKGGPDMFGYKWIDSDETGGPLYQWNDISSTGMELATVSNCDDCYQVLGLSFQFPFYGNEFNQIYVGSNGYITFGGGSTAYTNYPIPYANSPANLVAGFWDDLCPEYGGTVYFQDFEDHAVVQFEEVVPYSDYGSVTFQMVLKYDGTLTFYYENLTAPTTNSTVGIQNSSRDDGLQVVYNASYLKNGLAVRISPTPQWFSITPESGECNPGEKKTITLTLDATELQECVKTGRLLVSHNDPVAVDPVEVPVTLTVRSEIVPPQITQQPQSVTVPEEGIVDFSITATGTALSYQWRKNGAVIPGATSANYVTDPVTLADNGSEFFCEVSNTAGSVVSDPAILTVIQVPPVIITHPQSITVDNGDSVTFSVEAAGSGLQYQWTRNGENIGGADAQYSISKVNMNDNGAVFKCIVSNFAGSVESEEAVLTVIPKFNYQLKLLSIGSSSESGVNSPDYTAVDVIIGSNASGVVRGQRFRLFLK